MNALCSWVVRHHAVVFTVTVVITVAMWPWTRSIPTDNSVQSLFSPGHPRLEAYQRFTADFGGDATVLAVYEDKDLLTSAGLARQQSFARSLASVAGIRSVAALADLPRPKDPELWQSVAAWVAEQTKAGLTWVTQSETQAGTEQQPSRRQPRWKSLAQWFVQFEKEGNQASLESLRDEICECEMYRDIFISADGTTTAIVMQFDRTAMASGSIAQTVATLRSLAISSGTTSAQFVGSPVLISDVYTNLNEDAGLLTTVCVIMMALVILVLFRNIRWVLLPLLLVWVALVWTRVFMFVTDLRLSIIGAMTAALVTVLGIATVIHIAVKYLELMGDQPGEPEKTMEKTAQSLFPAVFWTCATTAMGFGSLASSDVAPVRNYGLLMAAASLLIALATFTLVPGGVLLFRRLQSSPEHTVGEATLADGLGETATYIGKHGLLTTLVTSGVIGLAGWGCLYLDVETDFTKNFRDDSSIIQGYRFVESRLGGAGLIDVTFATPDKLTTEDLEQLRILAGKLRALPGVTKVTTLADAIDFLEQTITSSSGNLVRLLPAQTRLELELKALALAQPETLRGIYNSENKRMRIVLRVQEQQSVQGKEKLLEAITSTAEKQLGKPVELTGLYVLLVYLIDSLLEGQWLSFIISCVGNLTMMALAFRSVRLGLIAFLPNLLPVVLVIGLMGWLGLKVNVVTAMIGSISMGIVVDFAIHYLYRFRKEWRATGQFLQSLTNTHRSTGKGMVFTNVALVSGFLVLVFSSFLPTIQFGALVSVAIIGGLIGNLTFLPVLLQLFYPMARNQNTVTSANGMRPLEENGL